MDYPILQCSGVEFDPGKNAADCVYDAERGERAVSFFAKALRHTKGPLVGKPFQLQPWQADVTRNLFGWVRPDGTRRFRQTYITVPRKNGKTTWSAGIANLVLLCDGEARAECYCAATDRAQAALLFDTAAAMIKKSPSLAKNTKIIDSQKRIVYKDSFMRAIPANEAGAHGFDVHLVVGDELHAWPGRQMYDVLITGMGARPQPLCAFITTAGFDRQSICWKEYSYARGVRDGKIDDPYYLPVIYEAKEKDDWHDKAIWQKANPNYGVSLRVDYLEREYGRAVEEPSYQNTFRRLHLNQWTSQSVRWLDMDRWRSCDVTTGDIPAGAEVYGGLDMSETTDMTAWCLVARKPTGGFIARWHFWMPQQRIEERERRDRVPYSQWVDRGLITAIPGARIREDWIEQRILEDSQRYNLRCVGYDPWHAEGLMGRLEYQHGQHVEKIPQGFAKLSFASKELEALVQSGTLDHGDSPIMNWQAEAVEVKSDPKGNIMPCRPVKGSAQKIDGIAALIDALVVAIVTAEDELSVYETRGPLVI